MLIPLFSKSTLSDKDSLQIYAFPSRNPSNKSVLNFFVPLFDVMQQSPCALRPPFRTKTCKNDKNTCFSPPSLPSPSFFPYLTHTLAPIVLQCFSHPCPLYLHYMLSTCPFLYRTTIGQLSDIY